MNKFNLFLVASLICISQVYGQQDKSDKNKNNIEGSRFQLGGELALSFGTITYVNISPRIGYRFTEKLTLGTGFIYNYLKDNRFEDFDFSTYGGLLYANYVIIPEVMLVGEFQNLSTEGLSPLSDMKIRTPVSVMFLGAAYRTQLGGSSFGYISLLYDVIDDINSPYSNPYFGVGLQFGL